MLIRLPVPSCVNAPETTAVPAPLLLAAEFGSNAIVGNDLSSGIAGIYGGYRRLEREGGGGGREGVPTSISLWSCHGFTWTMWVERRAWVERNALAFGSYFWRHL